MQHQSSWVEEKNGVLNSISIGYNNTRGYHNISKNQQHQCSTHAEMDAINKLKTREKNKKLYEVNLMVIRVNNSGDLCSSQPCHKCVNYMKTVAVDKGYKIKRIYYSTSERTIENKLL